VRGRRSPVLGDHFGPCSSFAADFVRGAPRLWWGRGGFSGPIVRVLCELAHAVGRGDELLAKASRSSGRPPDLEGECVAPADVGRTRAPKPRPELDQLLRALRGRAALNGDHAARGATRLLRTDFVAAAASVEAPARSRACASDSSICSNRVARSKRRGICQPARTPPLRSVGRPARPDV